MAFPGFGGSPVDPLFNLIETGQTILKAAAAKKGQKPAEKPNRFVLLQHQYGFLRSPKQDNEFKITTNLIFHEFPPCVVPFSTLEKRYYDDLRLEIAHRGSYLLLRSICPAHRLTAVTTIAEDENGDVQIVQIYNQDDRRAPESILPQGQIFIVKEPFFKTTAAGGTSIRVDHVSDITFLDGEDERIPPAWQPRLRLLSRTASDWKEDGNVCYKEQKYHEASQCYTKGLEIPELGKEVEEMLKLNRAQAFLKLGYFEKAIDDADSVLEADPLSLKGLFRSATALYEDGQFDGAKTRLVTLLKTYPGNAEAKAMLLRTYRRLHEARTGEYDFVQLGRDAKQWGDSRCKLDCAEFVGPVEVRSAGAAAGRGLFTTQSVRAGQMLLCSKAFVVCHTEASGARITYLMNMLTKLGHIGTQSQLGQELVQALYHNPRKAEEFLKLYSGNYKRVEERKVDGKPIVDTHLAFRIMQLNSFGCSRVMNRGKDDSEEKKGSGIWVMPSYINHSCWPTACRSFLGDMMIVRAARDLAVDEQVLFDYWSGDPTENFEAREKRLKLSWGFMCTCYLCLHTRSEPRAARDNRKAILDKVESHRSVLGESQEKMRAAIPIVRRLLRNLRSTYSKPESSHPRMELMAPYTLLEVLLVRAGRVPEVITLSKEWLISSGFAVEEIHSPRCKVTIKKYGVLSHRVQSTFVQLATGYGMLEDPAMARAYRDAAADLHEIIYGEKSSFAETFRDVFIDARVPLD